LFNQPSFSSRVTVENLIFGNNWSRKFHCRPDAFPVAQPTSVKALKRTQKTGPNHGKSPIALDPFFIHQVTAEGRDAASLTPALGRMPYQQADLELMPVSVFLQLRAVRV